MTKYLLGVVAMGLLIFLPAGSFLYFGGLLLMGILFVPMLFAGIVLMAKNPELLKKRLNAKEKLREQGVVIRLSGLMFLAGFVIAGLGFRFGWYMLPRGVELGGTAVFLAAYALYAEVLRKIPIAAAPLRCRRIRR